MSRWFRWPLEMLFLVVLVGMVNRGSITEAVFYHEWNASLIDSLQPEDEMRYLAKIREAAEGRWLMGNPILKEYRDYAFSPSGFVEWIPAMFLRMFRWNWGAMLMVTDILFAAITLSLLRIWLGKLCVNRWIAWACLFAFISTSLGGSLNGLLRDTAPKFIQPLAVLYLILLCSPKRDELRNTIGRSALVGAMFYTYPYHWTLFILCEAVQVMLFAYEALRANAWRIASVIKSVCVRAAAAIIPFALLAVPLMLAMRRMLALPQFADFYSRYHIVYTHIPAAPTIQLMLGGALVIAIYAVWSKKTDLHETFPLMVPIIAMLFLLNANIVSGKDPELLGHGGKVILPVAVALVALSIERLLSAKVMRPLAIAAFLAAVMTANAHTLNYAQHMHIYSHGWNSSDERKVIEWLAKELPSEQVIAAPRVIAEKIPVLTNHYLYFGAGAHFFWVPIDEVADRYLGWVGLYPADKEPTDTATVIVFGNHPGAQWSKDRTVHRFLHPGVPFSKTMADYIPRQDLREQIDREHAKPDVTLTAERFKKYGVDVFVAESGHLPQKTVLVGLKRTTTIGKYEVWVRG